MADLFVSTLIQGLIYALVSFGVYITYSILDFPDLGVDGTFPLGAAVTALLLIKGVDPWLTLVISLLVGALAGLFTGVVHVRLKVRDLLAGIITMTALFSVNLLIAGGANLPVERAVDTIFTAPSTMAVLGGLTLSGRKLVISLVLAVIVKLVLDLYFKTKSGLLLRAVGDNAALVTSLARDKGSVKILGLMISNGLVALSSALLAQYQGNSDINMGRGAIVIGLAAVVIGKALLGKRKNFALRLLTTALGAVAYYFILAIVIWAGLSTTDLKLFSALVVTVFLAIPYLRKKWSARHHAKGGSAVC